MATPILGHRLVAYPGFIPWFLRSVARCHCFKTQMRPSMPTSSATAPALRPARSCTVPTGAWRTRFCCWCAFEGQRLQAPTQVLFGANDFYIPVAVLEEIEAHGADLTLEVVEGCSHWMPEERPDLITDREGTLFSRQ